MYTVVGEVDYVQGQKKYIKKHGELVIDAYNINDIGDIVDIS